MLNIIYSCHPSSPFFFAAFARYNGALVICRGQNASKRRERLLSFNRRGASGLLFFFVAFVPSLLWSYRFCYLASCRFASFIGEHLPSPPCFDGCGVYFSSHLGSPLFSARARARVSVYFQQGLAQNIVETVHRSSTVLARSSRLLGKCNLSLW